MINRDARHIALPQVGERGQRRIADGSALLIGVGGIGCATATCLTAAGIGRLVLNDFDTVDATNLGRQPLYLDADVGKLKVDVAAERLSKINAAVRLETRRERMTGDALLKAIAGVDVVLDGCDNFATRFAVNDACVRASKRLISGAAIRFEGQIATFGPGYATQPCYRCLYKEADESLDSCAGNGVLSPVPAIIGNLMAVEALKTLIGLDVSHDRLHLYDALSSDFRTVTVRKRNDCPTCQS